MIDGMILEAEATYARLQRRLQDGLTCDPSELARSYALGIALHTPRSICLAYIRDFHYKVKKETSNGA